MFWENYTRLCREQGTSPTALSIELGFSNATASRWKKGAIPNGSTLKRIADHFGITVSELLGETKKPTMEVDPYDESIPFKDRMEYLISAMNDDEKKELENYIRFMMSKKNN